MSVHPNQVLNSETGRAESGLPPFACPIASHQSPENTLLGVTSLILLLEALDDAVIDALVLFDEAGAPGGRGISISRLMADPARLWHVGQENLVQNHQPVLKQTELRHLEQRGQRGQREQRGQRGQMRSCRGQWVDGQRLGVWRDELNGNSSALGSPRWESEQVKRVRECSFLGDTSTF